MSLFEPEMLAHEADDAKRPLAERMRPDTLEDFIGQEHMLGPGKPLRRADRARRADAPMILWGPPGVGKTTLAKLIAGITRCEFIPFSAVLSGIKEIKAVMADAERLRRLGRRTILFIDEIHRFNKAQQDAFLPYVERGDIILIGATTENPSFEVISALLSRSRVYALRALTVPEIVTLLRRALPVVGDWKRPTSAGADRHLRQWRRARRRTTRWKPRWPHRRDGELTEAAVQDAIAAQGAALRQGRRGALQPDLGAAQIGAVERCGCRALLAGAHAGSRRGPPVHRAPPDPHVHRRYRPGRSARAGAGHRGHAGGAFPGHSRGRPGAGAGARFICRRAEVRRGVSRAGRRAGGRGENHRRAGPDEHLRNAVTRHMKEWGYGEGYQHAHNFEDAVVGMECLPPSLAGRQYYFPTKRGVEKRIAERLAEIRAKKAEKRRDASEETAASEEG